MLIVNNDSAEWSWFQSEMNNVPVYLYNMKSKCQWE